MSITIRFLLLISLTLLLILGNLSLGSEPIPLTTIGQLLLGQEIEQEIWETIFWKFRLPKVLTAICAGGALALSGLLMQTFFQNPIAGPFILGISSGASLGVALLMLAAGSLSTWGLASLVNSSWSIILFASLGSSLVLLLLLAISWRVKNIHTLLILGLMFGSASSALVSLLQFFSSAQDLQGYVFWSMGSLSSVYMSQLSVLIPICCLGFILCILLNKSLDVLLLGENYAQSMGLNLERTRLCIIVLTAVLSGSVTAFCGPIAFIGIATPHLARILFKTHKHIVLICGSTLLGIALLVLCQLIAQLPGSEQQLPINIITSFLGAPMVIWIVLQNRK